MWLLLAAIVAFSFISNDFGLVDIQKTAIVLAAGIDRNAEKGYTLTAQIAVPKGVDRTTGGTSSVEFVAEGETIADCVSDIYCKTGWVPKFVFCNPQAVFQCKRKIGKGDENVAEGIRNGLSQRDGERIYALHRTA